MLTRLALLLGILAAPPGWWSGAPAAGGGGGGLCPGSFAFCQDFEAASNGCTGESPAPTVTGTAGTNLSCDCTTSTNCIGGTRPATVPQGTQVAELSNEGGSSYQLLTWLDAFDNADASDSQYGRFCMMYSPTDAGASGVFMPLVIFKSDSTEWEGSGGFEAYIEVEFDGTPQIRLNCPDDFGSVPSSALGFSAATWTEITWKTVETTAVMELCVNAANGDGSCVTCDGSKAANTVQDGFAFYNDYTATSSDQQAVLLDAIRVQTSAFGATQGCSGL